MQVRNFFHAEPAELGAADRAGHVVAGPVVHLDDQHVAARTNLESENVIITVEAALCNH
jgi:hypothetical protein